MSAVIILIILLLLLRKVPGPPTPPVNGEPPPPPTNGVQLTAGLNNIIYGGPNRRLRDVISFGNLSDVLVIFWLRDPDSPVGWRSWVPVFGGDLSLDDVIWNSDLVGIEVTRDHFWSW